MCMTCGVAYASGIFTDNIKLVLLVVMAFQSMQVSELTKKAIEKRRQQKAADFSPPRSIHHFSEEKFYENFCFRKHDFMRLLRNLKWLKADGVTPKKIKVGKKGHRQNMRADWLLMCLMRRLARPGAVIDVAEICGGGRTEVTNGINYALNVIYYRYGKDLGNVSRFAHLFPAMAAQLKAMGCPFGSCIGFLDGNNPQTARPGGAGCVKSNLHFYFPMPFACLSIIFVPQSPPISGDFSYKSPEKRKNPQSKVNRFLKRRFGRCKITCKRHRTITGPAPKHLISLGISTDEGPAPPRRPGSLPPRHHHWKEDYRRRVEDASGRRKWIWARPPVPTL